MVAATWSKTFDLNREAERLGEALETKDFDEIEGPTVLKVLTAVHSDAADRGAIIGLRKLKAENLDQLVTKAKAAVERAVDLLVTDFGVHSLDFLPYEAHLTILSAIFNVRRSFTRDETYRVRTWFWRTALTEYYRGAADTFVTRSLREVKRYVLDGAGKADQFGKPPAVEALLAFDFRKNSASSRAFALALAKKRPRNLTNGCLIDTNIALSSYNRHEFHHVYPTAYLRRENLNSDSNRLMNICMLAASENKVISDQDPHAYIPTLIDRHAENADEVLESNLLPLSRSTDYASLTFHEFRERRASIAAAWLLRLCQGVE
jgi:hypothetical protein